MLTTKKEKRICKKYSARDEQGNVHCHDCPLVISHADPICKATHHYDRHTREWEIDDD